MADAVSRLSRLHLSPHHNATPLLRPSIRVPPRLNLSYDTFCSLSNSHLSRFPRFIVHADIEATGDGPKWWEKNAGPNMIDIHSIGEALNALSQAGDKLVIVEFYGTWCGSCRALFPRRLNVRVLPYFHFYRGADGLLESFSCSLAKFQKLKAAIATHNTPRCSIGPPAGVGDLVLDSDSATPEENTAEASPR